VASNAAIADSRPEGYSFNKLVKKVCQYTKSNQVTQLRSSLRKAKTHIRVIYPYIECDGQSLLSLAVSNQSERVVRYLKLRAKPEVITDANQFAFSK